jgi:hypothetical protein
VARPLPSDVARIESRSASRGSRQKIAAALSTRRLTAHSRHGCIGAVGFVGESAMDRVKRLDMKQRLRRENLAFAFVLMGAAGMTLIGALVLAIHSG